MRVPVLFAQLTHWLPDPRDMHNSTRHANDTWKPHDDIGWKTLEITWLTMQGNRLWVDAFDWLALAIMMQLIHVSVKSNNARASSFPMFWSNLGVVIGVLCLVDFIASAVRFSSNWRAFSALAGTLSFINTVILLPAWLLWMGKLIPGAKRATFSALSASDSHRPSEEPRGSAERSSSTGQSPIRGGSGGGGGDGGAGGSGSGGEGGGGRGGFSDVELHSTSSDRI